MTTDRGAGKGWMVNGPMRGFAGRPTRKPVPGSLPAVSPATAAVLADGATDPVEPGPVEQVKTSNSQSRNAVPDAAVTAPPRHFSPFRVGFLGGLGILLAWVAYQSLDSLRGTLITIAVAALLAIGLDPAVGFLIRRGLRRGLSVLVVMLGLLVFIGAAFFAVIPPIVNEVASFIDSIPDLLANLQQNATIRNLDDKFGLIKQLQDSTFLQNLASGAGSTVVTASVTVAGLLVDLLIVLVLTLYFLAGFPKIKRAAYKLAPASRRERVTELGDIILRQMGGYLGGASLIAVQAGIFAGVFASIVGLPYPWAIALGASLLDFIPVVGPITIGISMMLLGFTVSIPVGIVAAGVYLVQHLFEAYWLYPKVMQRAMSISTGSVVVAIIIGGALLGVTGALMAVPVAAAVQLIVREVVFPMQDRA
ncbi:MAG: AI-2E family transporter [Nakamurella sp.]